MADQDVPDKVIEIPDVGNIAFPGSMTEAQINAAATKLYQEKHPKAKQPPVTSWVDTAVDWLPTATTIAGGAAGGIGGGPVGAGLGAGAGRMVGEAAKKAINVARGKESASIPTLNDVSDVAASGVKDALASGLTAGVFSGAGAVGSRVAGKVAPSLLGAGKAVETASTGQSLKELSEAAGVLTGLFGHLPGGFALYQAPKVARVVGRGMQAAAGALEGQAAKAAAPAALSAAERAAQIPLRERLAQIPLQDVSQAWTAAKAATPAASIADDVLMVRALVAKGFAEETAIKIAAGTEKGAIPAVKQGWSQSIKARGAPIPEAALATAGKVSPAITELMESPTFKALAESVANRQP